LQALLHKHSALCIKFTPATGNSRHGPGPAVICARTEMAMFPRVRGNGGLDDLFLNGGIVL
jgi:hypothetical protein